MSALLRNKMWFHTFLKLTYIPENSGEHFFKNGNTLNIGLFELKEQDKQVGTGSSSAQLQLLL